MHESNAFEVGWGKGNELGGRAREDPEREKIGSIKAGPYGGKWLSEKRIQYP